MIKNNNNNNNNNIQNNKTKTKNKNNTKTKNKTNTKSKTKTKTNTKTKNNNNLDTKNNKFITYNDKFHDNNNNNIINKYTDNDTLIHNEKDNNLQYHIEDNKCITPCYPPEYLKYHPYFLDAVRDENVSCFNEEGYSIQCDNITSNYRDVNIFNVSGFVKEDHVGFLLNLYDINDVKLSTRYMEYEIEKLPSIFTMKRILTAIFCKFSNNKDFPLFIFSEKFKYVFKKYYKINKKIDFFEILKNIIFSNQQIKDIFIYFYEKFL